MRRGWKEDGIKKPALTSRVGIGPCISVYVWGSGEIAKWVKVLAATLEELSSVPRSRKFSLTPVKMILI